MRIFRASGAEPEVQCHVESCPEVTEPWVFLRYGYTKELKNSTICEATSEVRWRQEKEMDLD